MKKQFWIGIFLLFFSLCANTWANTKDDQAVQETIHSWFMAMKNNQPQVAAGYLAPRFLSIHTDGIVRNKAEEVHLIENLHMKEFHLTNFKFSQAGNIMVTTFMDTGVEKIDDRAISPQKAGRLAVLQKKNDTWMLIAYANLDQIK